MSDMRIFPFPWWRDAEVVDTPVGALCQECHEPIREDSLGVVGDAPHPILGPALIVFHRQCIARSAGVPEWVRVREQVAEQKAVAEWRRTGRWPFRR